MADSADDTIGRYGVDCGYAGPIHTCHRMNILLTGASGFLGSRIHHELRDNHAVLTVGRTPLGSNHLVCDLTTHVPALPDKAVDVVINAAGKAQSVPRNASEKADYDRVNVAGTARLLTALEQLPTLPDAIVHISSVLVYGRLEGQLLDETASTEATDMYGLSKIRAEAVVQDWGVRTGVRTTILRLPLVAADPPAGNLARLVNAIQRGYYVRVGDGTACRSMVRADDVAASILRAGEVGGTFNLTDGYHPTIRELEEVIIRKLSRNRPRPFPVLPLGLAKAVARVGDGINTVAGRRFPLDSSALRKLTGSLTFSDDLARQHLNWNPRPVLDLFR